MRHHSRTLRHAPTTQPEITLSEPQAVDVDPTPAPADLPHRGDCTRPVIIRIEPMRGWQVTRCRSCGAATAARRTSRDST